MYLEAVELLENAEPLAPLVWCQKTASASRERAGELRDLEDLGTSGSDC